MKKRFRILTLALTLILLTCMMPLTVSANSPPPPPHYMFQLTNLPEGAAYVDLLIPLETHNEKYVEFDPGKLPNGFSSDAEILSYCENGYRSYTFHYLDAVSAPLLNEEGQVFFFVDAQYVKDYSGKAQDFHREEIYDLGRIRLAVLDRSGNILHVSPVLTLTSRDYFSYLDNDLYYDAETREFRVEYLEKFSAPGWYVVLAFIGMVVTCITELFLAMLFCLLKGNIGTIFLTNCTSQILMHTAYLSLYSVVFWKYSQLVILLEVLVYVGEYLWYARKMPSTSRLRVLLYTITANTASLLLGLSLYL